MTVRTLEAAGYDVMKTASGRGALLLAGTSPDLIILDIRLPSMASKCADG